MRWDDEKQRGALTEAQAEEQYTPAWSAQSTSIGVARLVSPIFW